MGHGNFGSVSDLSFEFAAELHSGHECLVCLNLQVGRTGALARDHRFVPPALVPAVAVGKQSAFLQRAYWRNTPHFASGADHR